MKPAAGFPALLKTRFRARSLRLRVIIEIVLSVLALLLILFFPLRAILLGSFKTLEWNDVQRTAQQLQLLVRVQQNDLARIVRDYAWWDDTYNYMADRNARYLENYALDTLLNNDMDVVVLLDTSGALVYGRMVSAEGDAALPMAPSMVEPLTLASKAVWGQSVPQAVVDVATLDEGRYLLVAAAPVLKTNHEGPPHGVMVLGRWVDAAMLEHFSALLGYPVTMVSPSPLAKEDMMFYPLDEESLVGVWTVRATDGTPVVGLTWTQPRAVYQYGQQALTLIAVALAVGGLFVGGLLLIMLELVVLQRFKVMAREAELITRNIQDLDYAGRLSVSGEDEIAHLAQRINTMLETMEAMQQDLHEQKTLLENLVQVARTVVEGLDLDSTLRNALQIALSLTNAQQGSLMLVDEFLRVKQNLVVRDETFLQESTALCQIFMDRGLAGWVARHGLPACVDDITLDARWVVRGDAGAPTQSGSALSVPVIGAGKVLGVLTLTHPERGHFTAAHTLMLQAAVEQIALALRNASFYEEQRRVAERQNVLYEMLRAISGLVDQDEVLKTAIGALRRLTHWQHISIFLPDENLQRLHCRASTRDDTQVTIAVTEGLEGRAFRERKTQYVPDVLHDPDYRAINSSTRSQLSVPLRRGERVLGVLSLENDDSDAFTQEDVTLAESTAETLAMALDGVYSHQEMRHYLANLNVMFALARMVNQTLDLTELLGQALYTLINSMGFESGAILLQPLDQNGVKLAASYALPAEIESAWKQGADEGWWQFLSERLQPLVIGDLERVDLPFVNRLKASWGGAMGRLSRAQMRCVAAAPLLHQHNVLGVLILMARRPRVFATEDVSLLSLLGQQIAAAVSHARLFQAISEERGRLEALIAAEQDGVLFILQHGTIGLVNPAALQLLQQAADDEGPITPEKWLLVAERVAPELAQIVHDAPKRQGTEGELGLGRRIVHWILQPVLAKNQVLIGWLLVLRDLTETRRLETIRDDMTHAMVHDLRNPLTAMAGAIKLLERHLSDASDNVRQLVDIAHSGTRRMLDLVNAILDLARLEEGQMPVHSQKVMLAELLTQELALQQVIAERKAITLALDCPDSIPPVKADPELLRRVMVNLIGNALKFTPEHGRVDVLVRYDAEMKRVLVSVRDTGTGVPEAVRGRLFGKFASGDQVGRGSGLGLAFCRMAMEAQGERIWLEDTGPHGSIFTLTLTPWTEEA